MKILRRALLLLFPLILLLPLSAPAEDVYVVKQLSELKLLEGKLPALQAGYWPYVGFDPAVLFGRGELENGDGEFVMLDNRNEAARTEIAIRGKAGQTVRGRIVVPALNEGRGVEEPWTSAIRFQIDLPAESKPDAKKQFLEAVRDRYDALVAANIPGGAWFRQQSRETRQQLGLKDDAPQNNRFAQNWRDNSELDGTFDLFSGGAAVSENLQLDRLLPAATGGLATVAIDSLQGITVREFDWKPMVKDLKPQTDPLAARIPLDQHALFFPSFAALIAVSDDADAHGTVILRTAEPRAEDAMTRQRYEQQLCLPTSTLARLLGPQLIKSVAMTGGDPYLRTGADVAILFEAHNADVLRTFIDGRVALAGAAYPAAKAVRGEIDGVAYGGMVSPDRVVCSYVATLGDAVVVTNSLAQLKRLVNVSGGKTKSLATQDEYLFFRNRYRRGAADESALLVISDPTIRRWCGPKWRIANSRRTRAAAVIAEVQAENMERLAKGDVEPGTILSYRPLLDAGKLTISRRGVQSNSYGTLGFATPIQEQEITHVTQVEADQYIRWRDSYQQNWSNYFDPIAARLYVKRDKLSVDVTVMPLIDRSTYNELLSISKGAKLAPGAGDPHAEALAQLALALNTDSPQLRRWGNFLTASSRDLKVDPLAWIGNSVTIYADSDPFWDELAKEKEPGKFLEKNFDRLPVAIQVEVRSPLKLTMFLASLRGYVEQSAPGMTQWEAKEYHDQSYVRVAPSEKARAAERNMEKITIFYAPAGDTLLVTLNESLLKKAIDRRAERKKPRDKKPRDKEERIAEETIAVAGPTWLGENVGVHVDHRVLDLMEKVTRQEYQRQMQRLAWSNLPILNEWHRLFPNQDPVALHQRVWQRRLVCPGGGQYRWNDKWQTMESTVYGHPGEPKHGPGLSETLRAIAAADFGLTFEEHGLRGRAELTRPASKTPAPMK